MVSVSRATHAVRSRLGTVLPPMVSLPLRARFGASRERELSILDVVVPKGATVIDVGAHQGVYTYHLCTLVGPGGQVIAYEPQPALIEYLRSAARFGRLAHVDLRGYALSDAAGEATLTVPMRNGDAVEGQATLRSGVTAAAATFQVPVATLDSESLPGPVAFIKIDVEGHEFALLRGARGLIARDRPVLLVEVEHRHAAEHTADVADLLLDELGYRAFELATDGSLVPVPRELWTAGDELNQRAGRRVNNFLFRP